MPKRTGDGALSPPALGIVLAAGQGNRLGGPKALLCWPEAPLAIVQAEALLTADCRRVLIVTRAPVAEVLRGHLPHGAELVCSAADESLGPAGSLAAAAGALKGEPSDALVLVTPVDVPPVRAATREQLLRRLRSDPSVVAVRPCLAGRRGHPVALRVGGLDRYRQPEPPPLRTWLRELGGAVVDLPVSDPGILGNVDTPDDLLALGLGVPRFFEPLRAIRRDPRAVLC